MKRHDHTIGANAKTQDDSGAATSSSETVDQEEDDHADDDNSTSSGLGSYNVQQHDNDEEEKKIVIHSGEGNLDRTQKHGFQARVHDLRSHITSREPAVSSNPGANIKQIYHSNPQPRDTSH